MAYSERELAVLRKYRIIDDKGALRNVTLQRPCPGQSIGPGPIIEPATIDRLISADTTPDKKWLNWIFYEAGGGLKAKQQLPFALAYVKGEYVRDRTKPRVKDGKIIRAAMTPEEVEENWKKTQESKYKDYLEVSDQDLVHRLKTFGYYRSWPGKDRIYEHVVAAISNYLPLYDKALEMNAEIGRGKGRVDTEPSNIGSYEDMNKVTDTVKRYFAARVARTDVRIGTDRPIYEDDNLVVIAPLTHAASVRYGFPKWQWSDPERFHKALVDPTEQNKWTNLTRHGSAIFFFQFKVPVPGWLSTVASPEKWEPEHATQSAHRVYDLTDLALHVSEGDMDSDLDTWKLYDQESRSVRSVRSVKDMIMNEPERGKNQASDSNPIDVGQAVYSSPEEAASIIRSLDAALEAVRDYMTSENRPKVVSDPLTGD